MHRCGSSLLAKPPTRFLRLYSAVPTLTPAEPTTSLSKPNALTLIHKTSSLLPSILSPAPKHPVESLKLWTDLLDYAHSSSTPRKDASSDGNRKARIVGALIHRSFSTLCVLTSRFPLIQCMGYTQTLARLISLPPCSKTSSRPTPRTPTSSALDLETSHTPSSPAPRPSNPPTRSCCPRSGSRVFRRPWKL